MSEIHERLKNNLSKLEAGNQVFIITGWAPTEEEILSAKEFLNKYSKKCEVGNE